MTVLAEAYLHGMDPFAIRFPDGWPIAGLRWYGLSYLAGFAVAWGLIAWMARTRRALVRPEQVGDMMIYVLVGVLVGGRLGYCVFYDPGLLVSFTGTFPFWGLLAINQGGMASHGGMIGVVAALWIFAVRHELPKLHVFDLAALTSAPGLFFGRLANFVNAELWGRPLPADRQADPPWWSVQYPDEVHAWGPDRLAGLDDAVRAVGESPADWQSALTRLGLDDQAGRLVDSTCEKIVTAARAGDETVAAVLRPLLEAYYPSQLIQALTDGPLLVALLLAAWWRPRKPGVVGAVFLAGYGVMRIISEQFRQPDEGVALLLGLTRGQLLSVLMIGVGVIGGVIVARRPVDRVGGLTR